MVVSQSVEESVQLQFVSCPAVYATTNCTTRTALIRNLKHDKFHATRGSVLEVVMKRKISDEINQLSLLMVTDGAYCDEIN
jgi:hypothetical protein